MGQQVNRSSKVKALAKATGLFILFPEFKFKNNIIMLGLVTSIRPEARWSFHGQIKTKDRTVECCSILRRAVESCEMQI